tara:strand:- start:32 stop:262 length:231 start_codon:yes stop_codon:yes gene_type:complete
MCGKDCMECNWENFYFGRCNGCGNCFNKPDWIFQRKSYENNILWDSIIDYYVNDGFNHEGNGVCLECANNYSGTNK